MEIGEGERRREGGREGGRERGKEALSCRPSAPSEYKWCLGDLVVTRSPTNESLMNVTSQSEGLDEVALQR